MHLGFITSTVLVNVVDDL